MIGTNQKSFDEIKQMLQGVNNLCIIGCGDCATVCQTGGEDQVREMADRLKKEGKTVVHTGVIDVACDKRLVKKFLRENQKKLKNTEAVLVLACGSGVQTVADCAELYVVPGLNSIFLGQIENLSKFSERCSVCGECVLADTGGLCPVSLCAKGLINGPCGGSDEGKCEVNQERDCVWYLIFERMKKIGQEKKYAVKRSPKSYASARKPRKIEIKRS